MSFWSGLGRAMESNEAQRNLEEARDEREEARAKAEAWQLKTFEYGARRDEFLDERYEAKTLLQQEQYDTAQGRLNNAEIARADQQSFNNTVTMFELTKDLSGPFGGSGANTSKAKAPSSDDMEAASLNIRSELGGKQGIDNLTRGKREFFETILSDPAAAYGVSAFLQAQRGGKEGNDINIMDLPDYISISGIIKGKGDPNAAKELRDMIMAGDGNITDLDKLMNGLSSLETYSPMQVVWSQTKAIKDLPSQEQDFKTFQSVLRKQAISAYNKIPADERQDSPLHAALTKLENSNETTQDRGFDDLFNLMGADLAEGMGLRENVIIKPYFAVIDANRKAAKQERMHRANLDSNSGEELGALDEAILPSSNETKPQEFKTRADARLFFTENPSFVGKIIIAGELVSNDPNDQPSTPQAAAVPIVEEKKGYQPRQIMANELNTPGKVLESLEAKNTPESPAIQDAIAKVPLDIKGAIKSIVEENDPAAVEGAISEITEEYGEDVAVSLFVDAGYQPDNLRSISSTVATLHGKGSETTNIINNLIKTVDSGGSVRASDVTKLIKETKALPRSPGRQDLLADLYDMRDEAGGR